MSKPYFKNRSRSTNRAPFRDERYDNRNNSGGELNSRVEKTIFKTKKRGEIMGIKGFRFSKKSGYLRFLAVEAVQGKVECVNSEGVEMIRYVAKITNGVFDQTVSAFFYPSEKILRFPSLRMSARINGKWTYWSTK